jgi:hypothetical protein
LDVDRLDPLAIEAWELLGYIHAFRGEHENAAVWFKKYFDGHPDIKLHRTPPDFRTSDLYRDVLLKLGQQAQADRVTRRIVETANFEAWGVPCQDPITMAKDWDALSRLVVATVFLGGAENPWTDPYFPEHKRLKDPLALAEEANRLKPSWPYGEYVWACLLSQVKSQPPNPSKDDAERLRLAKTKLLWARDRSGGELRRAIDRQVERLLGQLEFLRIESRS